MTIIQPNNRHVLANMFVGISALLFVVALGYGILSYSALVDLNHEVEVLNKKIESTEIVNAELKNQLYKALDLKNLEEVAKQRGLLKDKGAKYFETSSVTPWVFASDF